jgi:hypothetical protein
MGRSEPAGRYSHSLIRIAGQVSPQPYRVHRVERSLHMVDRKRRPGLFNRGAQAVEIAFPRIERAGSFAWRDAISVTWPASRQDSEGRAN